MGVPAAMKLVTYRYQGEQLLGGLIEDGVVPLVRALAAQATARPVPPGEAEVAIPGDMVQFLEAGERGLSAARAAIAYVAGVVASGARPRGPRGEDLLVPLAEVELLAPVPRPGKVLCIGLNYRDHAVELSLQLPDRPLLFSKYANAIVGPGAPIMLPPISQKVDYEAELAVVIGRRAKGVGVAEAMDYVAGYSLINDVSARDVQFGDGQWVRGKTFDSFAPLGPALVTKDEVPDPHSLRIALRVNGRTMQDSSTSNLVFGVPELVAFLAQAITLEPGDVIATGTPPGVGHNRKPPVYLQPGDEVEVEVEGIGVLRNPVVAG